MECNVRFEFLLISNTLLLGADGIHVLVLEFRFNTCIKVGMCSLIRTARIWNLQMNIFKVPERYSCIQQIEKKPKNSWLAEIDRKNHQTRTKIADKTFIEFGHIENSV